MRILDRDGDPLVLRQVAARGWPGSNRRLPGHGSVNILFEWVPSWCGADPGGTPAVRVVAGDLEATVRLTGDGDLPWHTPSCNRDESASTLEVSDFQPANEDEPTVVDVRISDVPREVRPGETFSYVVTLTAHAAVVFTTCPSYTESLGVQEPERYALNCTRQALVAGRPLSFEMRLTVPDGTDPGTAVLYWDSKELRASSKTVVSVRAD